MSTIKEPAPRPYPPAPWRSSGRSWMGLFKTDAPPPLPEGLKRLLIRCYSAHTSFVIGFFGFFVVLAFDVLSCIISE
jgi:hypothetical protein